jgi:hypothetical protein
MAGRDIRGDNAMGRRADTGPSEAPGGSGAGAARDARAARHAGSGADSLADTPAEPGTAWALWPTFLRRTLAEEQVAPARGAMMGAE